MGDYQRNTGLLLVKKVHLTSAQILALYSTPITLVPAPGAGYAVIIERIVGKATYSTAAYTGSNNLEFRYTNGSGAKVATDVEEAFINVASGTLLTSVAGLEAEFAPVANAAVVVCVPSQNPAAGSGVIDLTVMYRLVKP